MQIAIGLPITVAQRSASASASVAITGLTDNPTHGATAQIGVELTATATFTGDDPAGGTWGAPWTVDGVDFKIARYTPVTGDNLNSLSATFTAADTYDPATSASYTARYAPAVNTVAPAVTGDTGYADVLSASNGTWTGATGGAYTYQWQRNGVDIAGATSSSYMLDVADSGATIRAIVTYTNSGGAVSATSGAVTADTLTTAAVAADLAITGTTTQGQVLSLTGGAVTGDPTPSVTYQWLRGGSPIAGATSATYTLVLADVGANISCTKTATNIIGSGSDTADAVGPIAAASGDTSLTAGSVDFSWSTARTAGTDATGRAYIVVPTGSETLNQPTPAQTTDRGLVINGTMKNPLRATVGGQTHGLDERGNDGLGNPATSSDWDAAKNATGTISMSAGDRIVKAVAADIGTYITTRTSFAEEYQVLHAVASAPGADDVLGPTVTYTGHSYPDKYTVNWTSLLALFQNRSAATASLTIPPYATVMAQLDAQAPMYAYDTTTASATGYERMMPKGFHGTSNVNQYGKDISQMISMVSLGLHYDTWSSAEKTAILKKLVGLGIEWGFPFIDSPYGVGPDGAHQQFFQFPTILALIATGRAAEVPTFFADSAGGNWDQYFTITNALIASDMTPHTSTSKPVMWKEQTLPAQPGGNVVRIPAQTGIIDNQTNIPPGSLVMRKGAHGGVHVATVTIDTDFRVGTVTDVPIDAQPAVALTSGDVIWFEAPPVTVFDGTFDWAPASSFGPSGNSFRPESYSPSAGNEYRNLQVIAGAFLAFTGIGYLSDSYRSLLGYFLRSTALNTPASNNDYANIIDNWQPSGGTNYTAVGDVIGDATELNALLWATSINEGSAPTALTIQHIAHPSATVGSALVDGHVIGVVGDLTRQAVKIAGIATGGDNTPVEVRVVEDGDGTVVQDWTHLGFIDSGTFAGSIVLPIGSDWYNFEVRSKRNTGVTHAPTTRVGVGYKVLIVGQSQANIWSEANAATSLTMTAAYENTASLYKWQAYGDGAFSVAESFQIIADSGPDGPRAFVEQARALGITAPIEIVMEAVNGTGIDNFLNDADTDRAFSDFTDKTSKYGKDFTTVIEWWDTNNWSPLPGLKDIETLFGIEDHTTGDVVDQGLNEGLLPGYKVAIQLASRHSLSTTDTQNAVQKVTYANGTPKLPLTVGWPLADYHAELTGGPHPLGTTDANLNGGYRMALAFVESIGGTSFDKPYLTGTAERSADGTQITVPITLPNGGALGIEGSEVSGFYVSEGATYYDRNGRDNSGTSGGTTFTATVSGSNVVITRDSGTWAAAGSLGVKKSGRLEPYLNDGEETAIVGGELYETGVTNIKGAGLPVHGQMVSGKWVYGDDFNLTTIATVTQAATAPAISSSDPADDATDHPISDSISITFDQNIAFGTGNIVLRENNAGWGGAETFSVTADVGASDGQVSISGAVLTINPTGDLVAGREYAIRIDATAIDSTPGGVSFAGIANDTTLSFTAASAAASIAYEGVQTTVSPGASTITWTSAASGAGRYFIGLNTRAAALPTSVTLAGATATPIGTGGASAVNQDKLQFYDVTTTGAGNLVCEYGANPTTCQTWLWSVPAGIDVTGLEENTQNNGTNSMNVTSMEDGDELFLIINRNSGGTGDITATSGWTRDASAQIGSTSYGACGRHTKVGAGDQTITINFNGSNGDEIFHAISVTPA